MLRQIKCFWKNRLSARERRLIEQTYALCINQTLQLEKIEMDLDTLLTKVNDQKTVIDSAAALLSTLSGEIKAAGTDPVKLQAISDALDANTAELSAAVANNPDPAPPVAVDPAPPAAA